MVGIVFQIQHSNFVRERYQGQTSLSCLYGYIKLQEWEGDCGLRQSGASTQTLVVSSRSRFAWFASLSRMRESPRQWRELRRRVKEKKKGWRKTMRDEVPHRWANEILSKSHILWGKVQQKIHIILFLFFFI